MNPAPPVISTDVDKSRGLWFVCAGKSGAQHALPSCGAVDHIQTELGAGGVCARTVRSE